MPPNSTAAGFSWGEKFERASTVHNLKCQQFLKTWVLGIFTSRDDRWPLGFKHAASQEAPETSGDGERDVVLTSDFSDALGGGNSSPCL